MSSAYLHTPAVHVIQRSELSDIEIPPAEVISLVEDAYRFFAEGASRCPTKIMMPLPDPERDAVSYTMLGYDGAIEQVGFKTSYRQGSENAEKYYTTISLYDDTTGLPSVFMDCHRVGASRTPATTAIIAKHCATQDARSALMIGTGAQGLNTLPYLLTALPQLETLRLFGTHPDGIAASHATFARYFPNRRIEMVDDVPEAVGKSDIVVVASGRAAHPKIRTSWLPPGGLLISVASKGLEAGALHEADYAIATSEGQLGVTGKRLAGPDGIARIDAELPDIVAGRKPGRRSPEERVFAFSSGMIITDIPVAHALATRAISAGRGRRIELWT
ncbi:ornithine cyclodeaminase [Methylobacterium indicum]|uniref:ornithine cyclodeaminase n=1 Tax=Methylobacterium indicum TaxID=1775910 RepID=UPI002435C723|nr:ornithine cyclodeaminase [Methylobacterium indicum]